MQQRRQAGQRRWPPDRSRRIRVHKRPGLAAAIVAAMLVGCSAGATTAPSAGPVGSPSGTPSGSAAAATPGAPIVIGSSISRSGDYSDDGKAVEQGYQLWADSINAKGGLLGHPVSFKLVNDASSTDQVVTNYQNLFTVDKVDLAFGPFSSFLTIPASVIAARYGYLFPSPASGSPEVFNRGLKNVFHVQPSTGVQALQVYANWVLSLPAAQRPATAAYATQDDPLIAPGVDGVRITLEGAGIRTVYNHVYPKETSDYGPFALAIAQTNADIVVLGSELPDSVSFIKTFTQQKYNPKSLIEFNGPDQGAEFTAKVGAASEGIMCPAGWFPTLGTPGNSDFVSAFIAKYGGAPGDVPGDAAEAYSVGQQLEQAVNQAQSLDNAKLIDAFHSMTFTTVQGTWSYDAQGRPSGSGLLGQWVKGQFVVVYPADIAMQPFEYPKPNWP
jgi:branched-chain amino acid transport system substrate-binding protein